jgi:predicted ATP-grasp superfamily ATP-dependent carboligase
MDADQAQAFAAAWAELWNRRDVDAVLEHFDEHVVFSSPRARDTIGAPTVIGKAALGDYWNKALESVTSLHFALQRVVWDPARMEIAIIYDRHVNDRHDRAAEVLQFCASGLVIRGEVFYGVVPLSA